MIHKCILLAALLPLQEQVGKEEDREEKQEEDREEKQTQTRAVIGAGARKERARSHRAPLVAAPR